MDFLMSGSAISLLVTIPFVIVGVVFLILGLNARRRASIAKSWPQAMGQILSSGVEARRSRSGSGTSTTYYLRVVYTYQVSGQQFTNDRVTVGTPVGLGNYRAVEKRAAAYPSGSSVMVYYNPDNPADAVLEARAPSGNVFIVIGLVVFALLAVTNLFMFGMLNSVLGDFF